MLEEVLQPECRKIESVRVGKSMQNLHESIPVGKSLGRTICLWHMWRTSDSVRLAGFRHVCMLDDNIRVFEAHGRKAGMTRKEFELMLGKAAEVLERNNGGMVSVCRLAGNIKH